MIEIMAKCERCGKLTRNIQEILDKERRQDAFHCKIKLKDCSFWYFVPLKIEERLWPKAEQREERDSETVLLCRECEAEIAKGLEGMVARFNEEYRKLFFGKD